MKYRYKLFIMILIVMGYIIGCARIHERQNPEVAIDLGNGPAEYTIVIIDSCEYIFGCDHGSYNGGYFLTHKGNCKFCKQRNHAK